MDEDQLNEEQGNDPERQEVTFKQPEQDETPSRGMFSAVRRADPVNLYTFFGKQNADVNERITQVQSQLQSQIVTLRNNSTQQRTNFEQFSLKGYLFILSEAKINNGHGRNSAGVGFILSPQAQLALSDANKALHYDLGPRVIAIRMKVKSNINQTFNIFAISAYAPVSNAPQQEWDIFFESLQTCLDRQQNNDILLLAADCNSDLGTSRKRKLNTDNTLGPYGIDRQNKSGNRFLSFLRRNNLLVITTHFRKNINKLVTWINPVNKQKHQLDHFITRNNQLKFFTNAQVGLQLTNSDHRTIFCQTEFRKFPPKPTTTQNTSTFTNTNKLRKLNTSHLDSPSARQDFCDQVKSHLEDSNITSYSTLANAVTQSALQQIPSINRSKPDWFKDSIDIISPAIKLRNSSIRKYSRTPSTQNKNNLRTARKAFRTAISKAKSKMDRKLLHIHQPKLQAQEFEPKRMGSH